MHNHFGPVGRYLVSMGISDGWILVIIGAIYSYFYIFKNKKQDGSFALWQIIFIVSWVVFFVVSVIEQIDLFRGKPL